MQLDCRKDRFELNGVLLDATLFDFFSWCSSNLMSNATRGVLAEYIVAMSTGCSGSFRMGEWEEYDLLTPDGVKIEVKSSAYLQCWKQRTLSRISFSIAPSRRYHEETGRYDSVSTRKSDIYVFCLLDCVERDIVNPLNLNQWTFYVASTGLIDRVLGNQKSISLSGIRKLGLERVSYSGIMDSIKLALSGK